MLQVVQSLAPVVLTIALGAALMRYRFFSDDFRRGIERFAYWIGLPCLLVTELATARFATNHIGQLVLLMTLICFGGLFVAAILAWALKLKGGTLGSFIQGSFRGNIAFVGLPIIVYAVNGRAIDQKAVTECAVLVLAPIVLLYNLVAVLVLLLPQHSLGVANLRKVIHPLITNPLIIACVIGLLITSMEWTIPPAIFRTLESIGKSAPPLSLISLGASLVTLPIRGEIGRATLVTAVKLGVTPALAYVGIRMLDLTPEHAIVAMVYAACPTAVASYVMATQLKGDVTLSASIVVISTLASVLSLGAVLYFY